MSVLVLDTNVVSLIFKKAEPLCSIYEPKVKDHQLVIPSMTLAELRLWPLRNHWGAARTEILERHIKRYYTVHSPDDDVCSLWAQIRHRSFEEGHPISTEDAWIAATAVSLGVPLVTDNARHYRHLQDLRVYTA
jgi:tRNA(fMet)-specific endonuclease VapC